MATSTSKLLLRKPAVSDFKNFQTDLNDNYDKLDAAKGTIWGLFSLNLALTNTPNTDLVVTLGTRLAKPDGAQLDDPFEFFQLSSPTVLTVPAGLGGIYGMTLSANSSRAIYVKAGDVSERANLQLYAPITPFEGFRRNFLSRNDEGASFGWVTQANLTVFKQLDAGQQLGVRFFSDFAGGLAPSISLTGSLHLSRVTP